jgi:hypothetical protein
LEQECHRSVQVSVRFRTDTKRHHARPRPSALRLRAQ